MNQEDRADTKFETFGGAIGVVFYLAQAISVAIYIMGLTHAFTATFPSFSSGLVTIATSVNPQWNLNPEE